MWFCDIVVFVYFCEKLCSLYNVHKDRTISVCVCPSARVCVYVCEHMCVCVGETERQQVMQVIEM